MPLPRASEKTASEAKSSLNQLTIMQQDYLDLILKLWSNYQKSAISRRTIAAIDARLTSLQQYWQECQDRHKEILAATTSEIRSELDYFTTNAFSSINDCVEEVRDSLLAAREELAANGRAAPARATASEPSKCSMVALPPISLPKFSGELKEWSGFRDLFTSLVDSRSDLSNVQKLHYLKSSLEGKAFQVLKSTEPTEANYKSAWELLRRRYENPRAILYSYLDEFLEIPRVGTNRERDLRCLRDQADDIYHSILNLSRPINLWEDQFVHILLTKLDKQTRHDWELTQHDVTTFPTFEALDSYLTVQLRAFEAANPGPSNDIRIPPRGTKRVSVKSLQLTSYKANCFVCSGDHPLYQCSTFTNYPVATRIEMLRTNGRCLNCFRKGHASKSCLSKNTCRLCRAKHHTLTHLEQSSIVHNTKQSQRTTSSDLLKDNSSGHNSEVTNLFCDATVTQTILPTAVVLLKSPNGYTTRVRALFDQCSQVSCISESAAQILRLDRRKTSVTISGLGATRVGTVKQSTSVSVGPCDEQQSPVNISALILPKLSNYLPLPIRLSSEYNYLRGLKLADSYSDRREPVQLIIGADYYGEFLREGLIKGPPGCPIAQLTMFGWVLTGHVPDSTDSSDSTVVTHLATNNELQLAIAKFWELEEVPSNIPLSQEEQLCEDHFRDTHTRLPNGRYQVRLPIKHSCPLPIGDTMHRARLLYFKQEIRISKDTELSNSYHDFLREYLELGHMEVIPASEINTAGASYLPHHPVMKLSSPTTKIRVVFNASFTSSNGSSLNDFLLAGPKLQSDLFALIMKWRTFRFVLTTDIKQMFRQISVPLPDSDLQRILWRPPPEQELQHFRLTTVTYGTTCAPFLANRVIQQLAADDGERFPLAATVLREYLYVDDLLFGSDTIPRLRETRDQVKSLLMAGGFMCHKWASNTKLLLEDLPPSDLALPAGKTLDETPHLKILGVYWDPLTDSFSYRVSSTPPISSKRSFLAFIARFYDPLGWVAPCTIVAKILMQSIWLRKLDWDANLPSDLLSKCHAIQTWLPALHSLRLPRWTGQLSKVRVVELHGFCDASNSAYAAVIYLRSVDESGLARVSLLYSKTKVAPLKVLSIPRLELCAAVLLTSSLLYLVESMGLSAAHIYCWTDSAVVLAWLNNHPAKWKVFIANRVSAIQTKLPHANWRHVPTAQNPADCASRGTTSTELLNHTLWWKGPPWLTLAPSEWPLSSTGAHPDTDTELRSTVTVLTVTVNPIIDLPDRCSSWPKLLRIVSYMLRFIDICKHVLPRARGLHLRVWELERAATVLCKLTQAIHYNLNDLKPNLPLDFKRHQSLRALSPFMDEKGLLRAGGRLGFADIPYSAKFPILLPPCRLSELLIRHMHRISLHGGLQLTLRLLRQHYWITNARTLTKRCIRDCVVCVRNRAASASQQMGELPGVRVTRSRPFSNTGVDYAGPFSIRASAGRGYKVHKCYCVIFVCLTIRAVHLECASGYTTAAFLAAFNRFVSRRGLPTSMYSDNGTNFIGADRELRDHFKTLNEDTNLHDHLAADGVTWRFIPPASPHFGGLWEAGVKSVKYHLRRIMGNFVPTFEEFSTLLAKIEAVLNSRPMVPLRDDPNSFDALTPGHFLVGSTLKAVPEPSVLELNINRLSRWQTIQRFQQTFWKIWSNDYLNSLRQRVKWQRPESNIGIDDLVLVKNSQLPPTKWELARVVKTFPGSDGLVRVLELKTAKSNFRRPITQVCKLPVDTHADAESSTH